MEVVNNKDQSFLFKLKKFDCDSLTKVKSFHGINRVKLFEVGYNSKGCPVFIRVQNKGEFDEDYLISPCIEEIHYDGNELYGIPFIQDYNLLRCNKVSICDKNEVYVCIENEHVKGILIEDIELYNLFMLVDCSYYKREN